jgi:hypothetical protein
MHAMHRLCRVIELNPIFVDVSIEPAATRGGRR